MPEAWRLIDTNILLRLGIRDHTDYPKIRSLIDGLQQTGLVERVACPEDLRMSYAQLTPLGFDRLREASRTHIDGVHATFLDHFSESEVELLAELLGRLPKAPGAGSCTVE